MLLRMAFEARRQLWSESQRQLTMTFTERILHSDLIPRLDIATDAIDRLHTTAESHHRVMLLEVMGRHAGWIAVYSGIAGGADVILIPEKEVKIEVSDVIDVLMSQLYTGKIIFNNCRC
jgi:hypothetical protein